MQNQTNANGVKTGTDQVDKTKQSVHDAIDTASSKVHPAVDQAAAKIHKATDSIAGAASQAADRFGEKQGEFRDAQEQLLESCREYVHEKPLTALAIAAGAGFVLSWLMRD